jgi:soluble lytic murein transglycosylase-like protein
LPAARGADTIPAVRARFPLLIIAVAAWALAAMVGPARADIYTWVDDEGVTHFTNLKPRGSGAGKWKKVIDAEPEKGSKASAEHGACANCDKIPASDRSPERFHRYDAFIYEASDLYKIPVPLIRAVIANESDYDPHVVSSADARGLMQIMPDEIISQGLHDVFDPRENILGGTRLLRLLANRYDGDLVLTIAAYFSGVGSLAKYGNTVPPYKLTRLYVKHVLERYYKYKAQEAQDRANVAAAH